MPINRKMDKVWYLHIMEYYLAIKRNEQSHATTWRNIKITVAACKKSDQKKKKKSERERERTH